jgi:transcription elongation factor GreA
MASMKLSQAAYDRLRSEYEDLTTRVRHEVIEKIATAREEGDLRENAGYHAAKDEQGHLEARIRQLEHLLETAEIGNDQFVYTIAFEGDPDSDAERYMVGNMEEQVDGADVVSPESPLGAALVGAAAGDSVSYEAPTGSTLTVRILKVEPV